MSKLDRPLRLKHGLAAVVAALALGVAGTAMAGGAAQEDGVRASAGKVAAARGLTLQYITTRVNNVPANSQRGAVVDCPPGTFVVGGGIRSTAGFASGAGMMINTSRNSGNAAWKGRVDVFRNAGGEDILVTAICLGG